MSGKPKKSKKPIVNIPRDRDYWDRLVKDIRDEEERRSESNGRKGSRGTWEEGDQALIDDADD